MDEEGITVLSVNVQDGGVEFLLSDPNDIRKGVAVVHSYFVDLDGETYGQRVKDLLSEVNDLAEDIHYGFKRLPKGDK